MESPTSKENEELADAAVGLIGSVQGLRKDLRDVAKGAARSRTMIRWLFVSFLLDIILSVSLGFGFFWVDKTADKADKASSAQVVNCRASNVARAAQTQMWNYVLSIPPSVPVSPERQAVIDQTVKEFRAYLSTAFGQLNCDAID